MRVLVLTKDKYLGQKLRLELSPSAEVTVKDLLPQEDGTSDDAPDKPTGSVHPGSATNGRAQDFRPATDTPGTAGEAEAYDLIFFDADSMEGDAPPGRVVRMSREAPRRDGDLSLPIPTPLGAAAALLHPTDTPDRLIFSGGQSVTFGGRIIRLTEAEYTLLSVLAEAGGAYVGREELTRRVFRGQVSGSALNVYIHYLREKLEFRGEKVILSSRQAGYCLNGKFLGR